MSEIDDREPTAAGDAGMLGGLPRRRPAVPSPRRQTGQSRDTARPRVAATEPAERSDSGGLEGLARTGVSLAASAASVGLKLAGRTLDGIRGAVERR
jgi:hypothetical protein